MFCIIVLIVRLLSLIMFEYRQNVELLLHILRIFTNIATVRYCTIMMAEPCVFYV